MSKAIMHIDLNAFFIRCEEIKNPSLVGKATAIGHEGRSGIISTCSYAARKYGVHSGQPTFQATKLCPNLILIPGDHHYYSMMSNSFIAYLRNFSQKIEQVSIDEAFVDLSDVILTQKDPIAFFLSIQKGLFEQTGLQCSIGVASTKWLAKMGSDLKKPMGLTIIHKKDISRLLYPLSIDCFWGIGKKSAPRLKEKGIQTIGDLAVFIEKKPEEAKQQFGKFYFNIRDWLGGNSSAELNLNEDDPKSIGNSTTLMRDEDSEEAISTPLHELAKEVSDRAKEKGLVAGTITLTVKDTSFRLHTKAASVPSTNSEDDIYKKAISLYRLNFLGMKIRLIGVSLSRLVNPVKEEVQMSLWNYQEYEKMDETKLLINKINRTMEKPMLKRASDLKKGK